MHRHGLFSLAEHLERLSKDGDPLEVMAGTMEFECFRPLWQRGEGRSPRLRSRGDVLGVGSSSAA